jgi:hypothetical protein
VSRSLALVVAWVVAAGASLGVAWRGVAVVGEQVTDDRPAPLTAEELRTAGSATDGSSSSTAPSTPTSPSSTPTTTAPGSSPSETRDYTVIGGEVTLAFSPAGVTVVLATPNPGFESDQEPEHGNGIQVDFESDSHRSRVVGWWDDGPQEEIREDPDRSG